MSAKREKQIRRYVEACDQSAARCDAAVVQATALRNEMEATAGSSKAIVARAVRRERRERKAEVQRIKRGAIAGIALSSALSGFAVFMTVSTQMAAPAGTAGPDPTLVAATMAATITPAPVHTVDPYCEAVPLTESEQLALRAAAAEFGVPYPLALAVVDVETDFHNTVGDDGVSVGYMQVQPVWHQERMDELGANDLTDPASNFRVGLSYLAEFLEDDDLTVHQALMCYNMGPSGAAACWGRGQMESSYSKEVMASADYWTSLLGA